MQLDKTRLSELEKWVQYLNEDMEGEDLLDTKKECLRLLKELKNTKSGRTFIIP